jgi:hypothetical protein
MATWLLSSGLRDVSNEERKQGSRKWTHHETLFRKSSTTEMKEQYESKNDMLRWPVARSGRLNCPLPLGSTETVAEVKVVMDSDA